MLCILYLLGGQCNKNQSKLINIKLGINCKLSLTCRMLFEFVFKPSLMRSHDLIPQFAWLNTLYFSGCRGVFRWMAVSWLCLSVGIDKQFGTAQTPLNAYPRCQELLSCWLYQEHSVGSPWAPLKLWLQTR